MKQITTKSGFSCAVNENAADDIEFLDLICDIEDGDVRAYRKIIAKLLNEDDRKRLYDHARTEDGRVPVSSVSEELTEIIKALEKK